MKIAIVQTDIIWGDVQANISRAKQLIESRSGADLYLLPEMFTSGFNGISENEALQNRSETSGAGLEFLQSQARKMNCALSGSLCLQESGGKKVNRMYFVTPDSTISYDKRHLFGYGGEGEQYKAGSERVISEWKGVRFLLSVCYDLRFPVWLRNRGDYDVLLCVASWPESRRFAWDSLLRARAIENQCFVAACNRVGQDPSCIYNGGSVLLDPLGREITSCPDSKEDIAIGEADMEELKLQRRAFPVLADSDDFRIV